MLQNSLYPVVNKIFNTTRVKKHLIFYSFLYFHCMNLQTIKPDSDFHSIIEADYKYIVPHALYSNMQLYLLQHDQVKKWYDQLSKLDREKVRRISIHLN